MVQIGTWGGGGAEETCTKLYQRHHSATDRTTWEATGETSVRNSYDWRTYGYCCSGIFYNQRRLLLHYPSQIAYLVEQCKTGRKIPRYCAG